MIISVFDYTLGKIIIKEVPENLLNNDWDTICADMGFSESCVYMLVDNDLNISINTKNNKSNIILT